MDDYGIGSAAAMALQLYEHASRRSGRTLAMLERARNEDTIVCRQAKEAERLRRMLKEMGRSTRVIVVEHHDELHRRCERARGRVVFDHDWVHQFFVDAVREAEEDLQRLADSLSSAPQNRKVEQAHPMNQQRRGQLST